MLFSCNGKRQESNREDLAGDGCAERGCKIQGCAGLHRSEDGRGDKLPQARLSGRLELRSATIFRGRKNFDRFYLEAKTGEAVQRRH